VDLLLFLFFGVYFDAFFFFAPDVVSDTFDTGLAGAVGAAEKVFLRLDAVSDDFTAAMSADRREFVNRAFKTIENVFFARRNHFKSQIIIISANFTLSHLFFLL
jgi:hypothetical protein